MSTLRQVREAKPALPPLSQWSPSLSYGRVPLDGLSCSSGVCSSVSERPVAEDRPLSSWLQPHSPVSPVLLFSPLRYDRRCLPIGCCLHPFSSAIEDPICAVLFLLRFFSTGHIIVCSVGLCDKVRRTTTEISCRRLSAEHRQHRQRKGNNPWARQKTQLTEVSHRKTNMERVQKFLVEAPHRKKERQMRTKER